MTLEDALKDIRENGIELGAGDYVELESLKTVADADIIMNWIPCCEELPKEDGFYTTTRMTKGGLRYVAHGAVFSDGRFHNDRVIAWLPYFKPYEGSNVSADLLEE